MTERHRERLAAFGSMLLLGGLGVMLGFALLSMPPAGRGLGDDVLANVERSGVESAVTAVLMNFRGYDTLLELAVLFLALLGVWATGPSRAPSLDPPVLVLRIMNALLVPFLTLFAAYLLWAGSHAPGGAFQAGAVAGAAGVLVVLSGRPSARHAPAWLSRLLIVLGLIAFLAVGAVTALAGGSLLEYPQGAAKPLILLIESAAMVSIASSLLGAFLGGMPASQMRSVPRGSE